MTDNKTLARAALKQIFEARDPGAVDRFIGTTYRQHNPMAPDGPEGLRGFLGFLGDGKIKVNTVRALADGDLVALHTIYEGFGPEPSIAFDIWRVADGKLVEHWDCLAPMARPNPSGHTQTDGPTEPSDHHATEANRDLVTRFVNTVLVGGDLSGLSSFISASSYTQHNSMIADGLDGLATAFAAMAKQGITIAYSKLHRTVAEGNFVLAQSEGTLGGAHSAFYDLFRVEGGRIVEHWDVIQAIPAASANTNTMF